MQTDSLALATPAMLRIHMSSATKKLLRDALALPSEEREELILALEDSLDALALPLSDAWRAELDRRVEAVETGESQLIPGDAVDARLRAMFAR